MHQRNVANRVANRDGEDRIEREAPGHEDI